MNVSASEPALATIGRHESRNWITQLIAAGAIGIVVGAIAGAVLFSLTTADSTATAIVRLNQPPDLVAIAGGASQTTPPPNQDNLEQYTAGEVAYMSGEGFLQTVGARLGKSEPPEVKVVQDGQSSVVTISNTASSRSDAIRAVQMAIDLYREQIAERIDRQLELILPSLDQWERAADPAGALRIRELRDRVGLQAAQASRLQVLQPPTPDYVSSHRALIGAILGGLLGGAVLPLILMARRKRAGRLSLSPGASGGPNLLATVDGIVVPVVDLRQPTRNAWGDEQVALGRTLYSQLAPRGSDEEVRTIVVLGASPSSGTSTVAALLELGAAEHGPAQLTNAAIADSDPGTTVVVKAGVIGATNSIADAIAAATDLVLVFRVGADTEEQMHIVRSATASSDASLRAVFTSLPWWRFGRGFDPGDGVG